MPLHVLGGGNPDAGARTRTTLEQPFNFKSQQRFGYGQKTHAKLGGQLPARDYLPQTYGATEDALANDGVRLRCQTGLWCSVTHVLSPSVFPF
jgi:hypothetical protein